MKNAYVLVFPCVPPKAMKKSGISNRFRTREASVFFEDFENTSQDLCLRLGVREIFSHSRE